MNGSIPEEHFRLKRFAYQISLLGLIEVGPLVDEKWQFCPKPLPSLCRSPTLQFGELRRNQGYDWNLEVKRRPTVLVTSRSGDVALFIWHFENSVHLCYFIFFCFWYLTTQLLVTWGTNRMPIRTEWRIQLHASLFGCPDMSSGLSWPGTYFAFLLNVPPQILRHSQMTKIF